MGANGKEEEKALARRVDAKEGFLRPFLFPPRCECVQEVVVPTSGERIYRRKNERTESAVSLFFDRTTDASAHANQGLNLWRRRVS